MKALILAWLAGFLASLSMTIALAVALFQPTPAVEHVVHTEYRCAPVYETHIPPEYEFPGL